MVGAEQRRPYVKSIENSAGALSRIGEDGAWAAGRLGERRTALTVRATQL